MDPIAELLSELSGVRCSAGGELNSSGPCASQLQQLQVQLQLEPAATGERTRPKPRMNTAPPLPPRKLQQQPTQPAESTQPPIQSSRFLLTRLNDPKMSETENWSMESECTDHSLFVQELLLSTLVREESSSSDEDERGEMADFGAMGCVDIMPLDVALENLNLKGSNKGIEPPPPPL